MDENLQLAAFVADHDQDLEEAKEWWRSESDLSKVIVWNRMNKPCKDEVNEIVTRFAIIGFSTVLQIMEAVEQR